LPYKTRCKTRRSGAKVRAMKSCRNFSQQTTRSTPLDPNLMFQCVSYYLAAFGRVWLRYNTMQNGPTWSKSSCHEVASEFFVANAPDPPHSTLNSCFWFVLYYLDVCGTVWLPYKTQCKTGRTGAKVRAMKSCRNVSQRTHPIHPIGL
jgi:hypothetical protein